MASSLQNQNTTKCKGAGLQDNNEDEPQENTGAIQQGQIAEAIHRGQDTEAFQQGQNTEARLREQEDPIQQPGLSKNIGLVKLQDTELEGFESGLEAKCQEGDFRHWTVSKGDNELPDMAKASISDKHQPKDLPKCTKTGDDTKATSKGERDYSDVTIGHKTDLQDKTQGHNVVEPRVGVTIAKCVSHNVKHLKPYVVNSWATLVEAFRLENYFRGNLGLQDVRSLRIKRGKGLEKQDLPWRVLEKIMFLNSQCRELDIRIFAENVQSKTKSRQRNVWAS